MKSSLYFPVSICKSDQDKHIRPELKVEAEWGEDEMVGRQMRRGLKYVPRECGILEYRRVYGCGIVFVKE
jgi:hypothetical protein